MCVAAAVKRPGDVQRLVLGRRPADVELEADLAPAPVVPVGLGGPTVAALLLVDGDQAVRPARRPCGGLDAHRGGDEVGAPARPSPHSAAVDGDETVVRDLLPVEQPPDDVGALDEPAVAQLLARPAVAGHVLVDRLAFIGVGVQVVVVVRE